MKKMISKEAHLDINKEKKSADQNPRRNKKVVQRARQGGNGPSAKLTVPEASKEKLFQGIWEAKFTGPV